MADAAPSTRSTLADVLGSSPEEWQGRPIWAEIDLDAVADNVRALIARANGARLMAIVKANAYGHGAVPVAKAALEAGASSLGVICVDEGVQLRDAGIEAPIVVLGHTPLRQAAEAVDARLTPTVGSLQFGLALSRFAVAAGVTLPVHIKVDTGMARYGVLPQDCPALAESLRALPGLAVEGIFTHFASADDPDPAFTHEQYQRFLGTTEQLPWIPVRHAAASAATILLPEMALDMVRTGIAMYGYAPPDAATELRPVLSLKSRIARVHRLEAGGTVSYGRTWRAERPTTVGLVMAGYGDGVPRLLSNQGEVLIRGRRAPIIGRVCMDQLMIDLTDVPGAAVDDVVTLIGRQGDDAIGADDIGEMTGTISYEVLTGVAARVPRLYMRQGRVVEAQTLVGEATSDAAAIR